MKRRTRIVQALLAVVLLALVAAAAFVILAPRAMHGAVRPSDVRAAKAAGDELAASSGRTLLVFTAHPDDLEWWAGGTVALLARRNRVILVLGTSGDAGNGGLQSDLGRIRERLQSEGAAVLGLADVIFLRHPDGGLASAGGYPGEVLDLVRRYRPDAVITFDTEREGPVYHHEDHRAAGRAALAAARATGGATLYFIHTSAPDVIVDFETARAAKAEALTILWSYHDTSPLGFISTLTRRLGLERRAEDRMSRTPFPEVGVAYGEVLRREVVPERDAPER